MENVSETLQDWIKDAKKNAGTIVVLGVITAICGFLALIMPWAGGVGLTMLFGFLFIVGGVTRVMAAFSAGSFGRGTLAFIAGVLIILGGVLMITRPDIGLAALTLMLGAYLMVDGIFGAILAFQIRPEKGWGWMLFSAVLSVLLSFLLLMEWPFSGMWAIGTLVGINLLFVGFSLISIGSTAKKLVQEAA